MPGIKEIQIGKRSVKFIQDPTGPELLAALKNSLTAELICLIFQSTWFIADSFSVLPSEFSRTLIDHRFVDGVPIEAGIRYTKDGRPCIKSNEDLINSPVLERYFYAGLLIHDSDAGPMRLTDLQECRQMRRNPFSQDFFPSYDTYGSILEDYEYNSSFLQVSASANIIEVETRAGILVRIYRNPTFTTLSNLLRISQGKSLRGVLTATGDLWFGDAYKILHEEMVEHVAPEENYVYMPKFYFNFINGQISVSHMSKELVDNKFMKKYFDAGLKIEIRINRERKLFTLDEYVDYLKEAVLSSNSSLVEAALSLQEQERLEDQESAEPKDSLPTPGPYDSEKSIKLVVVTPHDFLRLTTTGANNIAFLRNKVRDVPFADYKAGAHPTFNVKKYTCPWIMVDLNTNRIVAADGRHRAARQLNAGPEHSRLPVLVHCCRSQHYVDSGDTTSIFDTKEDAETYAQQLRSEGHKPTLGFKYVSLSKALIPNFVVGLHDKTLKLSLAN